jgi:hypothetical protein
LKHKKIRCRGREEYGLQLKGKVMEEVGDTILQEEKESNFG